jgi:predicted ribosome quality control (RQC) complex YloA/Tae2 family protein
MDIFTLKALVDDLQPHLVGAVVSKVFQMSADDLLLRLWRQHDWRLLLSTHPQFALAATWFRCSSSFYEGCCLLLASLCWFGWWL